jgi:hypothetical protein
MSRRPGAALATFRHVGFERGNAGAAPWHGVDMLV